MCGICGIVPGKNGKPVDENVLPRMRDAMTHRGPDDAGVFVFPHVGLGSRRLSIIDLSEHGHMPMTSDDGRYAISYNGEVYNFRELREDLQREGWRFRSHTDTEVVLALYSQMGPAMLEHLNGMFAISIWDDREHTLFLARDRLGVKPLYCAVWQDSFYFSSEIKSLFVAGIPKEFDHSCWGELLCFRYLAGESTPFTHIKELLPGHYLILKDGAFHVRRWWNLADQINAHRENLPSDPVAWFQQTFDDSVRLRRISDVPLGVLLSGGLDPSSLSASLAMQAETSPNSFTMRFDDAAFDEGPLARDVAEKWNLHPHELLLSHDEIVPLLEEAVHLSDEPLAHGNELHILAISRFAKPLVTVLLSGEGADEVLGGYVRYRPLLFANGLKAGAPAIRSLDKFFSWQGRWHKLARFLQMDSIENFILFNACDVLPPDLDALGFHGDLNLGFRKTMLSEAQMIYPNEPVRQAMYLDQQTFLVSELDRIDRLTMGASIEARVPFLDYRLVALSGAFTTRTHFRGLLGKQLLLKAFVNRLPSSVLQNPKWGFGVPWKQYFRSIPELREHIETLHTSPLLSSGPFDTKKIHNLTSAYLHGNDTNIALVHQLAMITFWWDKTRLS